MDEQGGKQTSDYHYISKYQRCVLVNGPIIVGGGPSGLATASCLRHLHGVPCVILEKADCIASLWKHRTYDRLKLHLPKHFCELPLMPFPPEFPTYLSKYQFIEYLESYAQKFELSPRFNECVQSASYDKTSGLWKIRTVRYGHCSNLPVSQEDMTEYICRWVIVATGENAQPIVPHIKGMGDFKGEIIHTSAFKSGKSFQGKNVLVVGCANSGMEISLDLSDYGVETAMAARSPAHILPREMFGRSTFGVAMWLMKWLPIRLVDRILLFVTWLILGNTSKYGLKRPSIGPLELKKIQRKTPVLDAGALARIKSGKIKILPGVDRLTANGAKFVNGKHLDFDSVILATGYKSSVLSWLKECSFFSQDGMPKGWKGQNGLYAVGFGGRGLLGVSADAMNIAADVGRQWKEETRRLIFIKRE